jgi:molybdopterin synthase sulfur carrier subunit
MRVDFYATLRDIVKGKSADFDLEHGVTARELLDAIVTRYPAMKKELLSPDGRLFGHVHFFVNGRDIQFMEDDLETKIMPGDVVKVFPAVGGG